MTVFRARGRWIRLENRVKGRKEEWEVRCRVWNLLRPLNLIWRRRGVAAGVMREGDVCDPENRFERY